MSIANAFFSILTCLMYDGSYSSASNLFLQDLNAEWINLILTSTALDQNQNFVPVFEYVYTDPRKGRPVPVTFTYPNTFQGSAVDIPGLLAWYNTNSPNNTLQQYANLITIDSADLKAVCPFILVNQRNIIRREYVPFPYTYPDGTIGDATRLYLYIKQTRQLKILVLKGDQSIVGTEYYTLYYGTDY